MRPASDQFFETIRGSHRIAVRALALDAGQSGTQPVGTALDVQSGSVKYDWTQPIRATLDIVVKPSESVGFPTRASDPLDVSGKEIIVYRGVDYGGGNTELVSLGYFRIDTDEQDIPVDRPIRISAPDRMAGIVDARLEAPRQYGTSWTYGTALSDLITDVYPSAVIEWDDSTSSRHLGGTVLQDEDRYALADDLVTAVGKIFYWDHRGVLVVRDPPDTSITVAEIRHGPLGTLTAFKRKRSRIGVVNIIVATGEAAEERAPARGVARDDNPASPTFWEGPFGPVPDFYSSPLLTTDSMAAKAARTILDRRLGLNYAVDLSALANPAIEVGDPLLVTYSDQAGAEIHIVDSLEIGLSAGDAMRATMRERSVGMGGGGS
jgi:hypothetical protein